MALAGVGDDLLLANETVDGARLRAMAALDVPVTIAIDSQATLDAAADAGITSCLIDINVGLPRCGVTPEAAGALGRPGPCPRPGCARRDGLRGPPDDGRRSGRATGLGRALDECSPKGPRRRRRRDRECRWNRHPRPARRDRGDRDPGRELRPDGHPLRHPRACPSIRRCTCSAPSSRSATSWAVADVGLKALGMDHGNPSIARWRGVVLLRRARDLSPPGEPARSAIASASCRPTSIRRWRCTKRCGSCAATR